MLGLVMQGYVSSEEVRSVRTCFDRSFDDTEVYSRLGHDRTG
jgi:hypothetical protein